MASRFECCAVSVGETAWASGVRQSPARVMGVTSHGVFLLAPPQQIIFVTVEHYHSPLTINLDRSCDQLRAVEIGAAAQCSVTRLIFPSIGLSISLSENVIWHCPLPVTVSLSRALQLQTLNAIAIDVLAHRGAAGLAALLPHLLECPEVSPLTHEQSALLDRLLALRRAVQVGDHALWLSGLIDLLGQGRGLTPSGDDVVIGLLLMLARSPRVNSLAGKENMLKQVVDAAYQKTTTVSANLIECAASGQGDERLITVVDGILSGSASTDECVTCVLDWGASSGVDALVGMTVAV